MSEKITYHNRERWLDVAKFLGIVAVFVGHFGELAGGSYRFVFLYQNALFFFCAGYLHSKKHYDKFSEFLVWKCKGLLLPGLAFSLLVFGVSALFQIMSGTVDVIMIKENIIDILLLKGLGLGNWFFTGLLSVSVFFEIINRIIEKTCGNSGGGRAIVLLIICVTMYWIPSSVTNKFQFCNLGSVFEFGIYYALGHWFGLSLLPKVKDFRGKHIAGIALLSTSMYIYYLCLKEKEVVVFVSSIIIILTTLYIAKLFEKCDLFVKMGRYTMYCCGNEYIIRRAFDKVVNLRDLISNTIMLEIVCWLISICFVLIVVYVICPMEVSLIKKANVLRENSDG